MHDRYDQNPALSPTVKSDPLEPGLLSLENAGIRACTHSLFVLIICCCQRQTSFIRVINKLVILAIYLGLAEDAAVISSVNTLS